MRWGLWPPCVSAIHYLHSHMPGTVAGGFCFLQSRKRKYLSFSLDFVALSLYPLLLVHPSFYSVIVSGGRREPCIEIAVAAGTCNPELPGSSGLGFECLCLRQARGKNYPSVHMPRIRSYL